MNRLQIDQWMTAAAEAWRRGEGATTLRLTQRVLRSSPDFAPAVHLAGLVHLAADRDAQALPLLRRAVQLAPDNADYLRALGICHFHLDQHEHALHCFERTMMLRPEDTEARMNLAMTLERLDRDDEARRLYLQLGAGEPPHADACARLGVLAEERNDIAEAGRLTARALGADPGNVIAHLTQAQLDIRRDDYHAARQRLQQLLKQRLSPTNEALAASRLGRVLDRLDDCESAFHACERAHRALAQCYASPPVEATPYSMETIRRLAAFFDHASPSPAVADAESRVPVFLVGFPRSGTTLLDRILAAHPTIAVLEEEDTLAEMKRQFVTGKDAIERLGMLSEAVVAEQRSAYWRQVDALASSARSAGQIVIDKLPLNAILMGVIHRFFPDARFILALRDPRDVCLSCFMQSFGPNEAMRHMLDLRTIGAYYSAVMDLVRLYRERLSPRVAEVRYEEVVTNPADAIAPLLRFLDLTWHDDVLNYRDKLATERINTPSYHQVARPLYRSAIGRWRRYGSQLEPLLPLLQPYVVRFGYEPN